MNEERPTKMLYTMGEVAEMFDVKPSLLRFWEKTFPILKPQKNRKGNRLFTAKDIENLKVIYHLVKVRGMTLEGAKRQLKQSRNEVERDAAIMERLEMIRAALLQIKTEFKDAEEKIVSVEPEKQFVDTEGQPSEIEEPQATLQAEVQVESQPEQELTLASLFGELPPPAPEVKLEKHNPKTMSEFKKMQNEKIRKNLVPVDAPSITGSLFDKIDKE
jgi:DNA-binding transcriptional MerR regulator